MKIIENNVTRYESPTEKFTINDYNSTMTDREIYESMLSLIPENFQKSNEYFNEFSKLSAFVTTREILLMEDINNIYNPDLGSENVINSLAKRYGITFPMNYEQDKKRLILKYFPNFIKIKGTETATFILNFIDKTESDFYQSDIESYKIEQTTEGYLKLIIENQDDKDRISNYLKFSQSLINRVTPAGMYIKIIIE